MKQFYSFSKITTICTRLPKKLSMLFLIILSQWAFIAINGQTVTTDKPDYVPGDWVTITGSGWEANEPLSIVITEILNGSSVYNLESIADGSGDFSNNEFLILETHVGVTFDLTVTGGTSGDVANTTFTDAAGSTNKVYQHWADGDAATATGPEWNNNILSANKSDYFEGEVIPHVFVYKASNQTPLTNGQSYSFNVTYNYYQQNTNAGGFSHMTTFNISRIPGPNDATNPYITPTLDNSFTNNGGTQGNFYTVDANITNVSGVTYLGTGSKDGYVTITFTYTGTTTTDGIAEIYYGLYIAEPGMVPNQGSGATKGASAWTGGSCQTTVDIGGSGATSIQLSPAAIIAGKISGTKYNDLNSNGTRDAGEGGLANWTIYLDNNSNINDGVLETAITDASGNFTFSVTPDADKSDADNDPYYVYEENQTGWTPKEPASIYYGPITITALDPTETGLLFGNYLCNVDLTAPDDFTANSCGYADQAAVDAAFAIWLSGFTITGGNNATGEFEDAGR